MIGSKHPFAYRIERNRGARDLWCTGRCCRGERIDHNLNIAKLSAQLAVGSGRTVSGLSALRRNDYDAGALENAAKIDAAEIAELEHDLAGDKPDQASGRYTEQDDRDPDLQQHGKRQDQQGLDTKQGAHHQPYNQIRNQNRHLSHHAGITTNASV
jgi:hypothetical protein